VFSRAQFELTVVHSHDCGDHMLLTCNVGEATPPQLACEPLTTGELRARGLN
jgi:flavin reductase (DIM6/NTAB) family NADH-FMN oxidoreductase RutF